MAEQIRHDWCWGGEAFRQSLLAQVDHAPQPNQVGAEWRESQLQKAEGLVQAALAARGWKEEDLIRSSDLTVEKMQMARQLRLESTMSLSWIAKRLRVRSAHTLRNRLQVENEKSTALR